jgi:hypothetical protein
MADDKNDQQVSDDHGIILATESGQQTSQCEVMHERAQRITLQQTNKFQSFTTVYSREIKGNGDGYLQPQ